MLRRWLQYHDKDTGNLLGTLPLAIGMRVALTEHIANKSLLAGEVGTVHSWEWADDRPRPRAVYVKFDDKAWQLEGIDEPGVYPITPVGADWYLDRNKGEGKKKALKVRRTQLPLAPAYGMTAHYSQGKTLQAALVDLHVDPRVNQSYGAVATTRVRSREDILIMRDFPLGLYQRKQSDGPKLLLKQLRGEQVNWANYRDSRAPCAACQRCRQPKRLDNFSHEQWEKARANLPATCLACVHTDGRWKARKLEPAPEMFECVACQTKKVPDAFPRAQLAQPNAEPTRRCLKCLQALVAEMTCCRCEEIKPAAQFNAAMITMPPESVACRACQGRSRMRRARRAKDGLAASLVSSSFPRRPAAALTRRAAASTAAAKARRPEARRRAGTGRASGSSSSRRKRDKLARATARTAAAEDHRRGDRLIALAVGNRAAPNWFHFQSTGRAALEAKKARCQSRCGAAAWIRPRRAPTQ